MAWEVGYFAGSPVATLLSRWPVPYRAVLLDDPEAGPGDAPDVILVATASERERAVALPGEPRSRRVIAVGAGADVEWMTGTHVHGWLPPDAPLAGVRAVLDAAFSQVDLARAASEVGDDLARLSRQLGDLLTIGTRLSAERDIDALLELILTVAREVTLADAGSLYLLEDGDGPEPRLRFTTVQNDSLTVPFKAFTIPVSAESVAGHVALTGEPVNLVDAYRPPAGSPFRIDPSFDRRTGYRTMSMLVIPLRKLPAAPPAPETAARPVRVIGVLQLINARPPGSRPFQGPADVEARARPFSVAAVEVATALASLAAVALESARLYADLRTALRDAEQSRQRIVQGERLRALGEMAGGVAHDFNNVLAVVLGRTELLLHRVEDPDIRRQLEVIKQVGQDGAHTVRRIQEFTRMRRTRPFQRVNLGQVVEEVVEALRPRWGGEAQLRDISHDVRAQVGPVPEVVGDPAELRECLANLLINALDAMPRGGQVTLLTRLEGGMVECVVTDTGVGMTEDVRQRVFEPFFTTKAEQGTGLGLSIAYGIVSRHGGEISVDSRPGEGSRFVMRLPVAPAEPRSGRPASDQDRPRKVTILVIDDEAPVREVVVDILEQGGHTVEAAESGEEGLARLAERRFDVVMVDLAMPGLSGWDVARRIAAGPERPAIVLITGWGDQIDPNTARTRGIDQVVSKPFDMAELNRVLAHVLSRKEAS